MVCDIRIGLLGCGNVGSAFWNLVEQTHNHRAEIGGRTIDVRRVLVRDLRRERPGAVDPSRLTDDPSAIIEADDIDIVVEAMGGFEPAYDYLLAALNNGKHVVTANKVVVARSWPQLQQAAEANGVQLHYEAAVAAAIPIVRQLRGGLSAVPIRKIRGIVNGTSNYILSQMKDDPDLSFEAALADAQRKGYAEPDPSDDLDGWDAMYKIAILAALGLHWELDLNEINVTGIRHITKEDVQAATAAGKTIRLVAQAEKDEAGRISLRVAPQALPATDPLAQVHGVENAIVLEAPSFGTLTFRGPGAGPTATASALLGDVRVIENSLAWKAAAY